MNVSYCITCILVWLFAIYIHSKTQYLRMELLFLKLLSKLILVSKYSMFDMTCIDMLVRWPNQVSWPVGIIYHFYPHKFLHRRKGVQFLLHVQACWLSCPNNVFTMKNPYVIPRISNLNKLSHNSIPEFIHQLLCSYWSMYAIL